MYMTKHSKSETDFRQFLLITLVAIISILGTLWSSNAFSGKIFQDEYELYQSDGATSKSGILLNTKTGDAWWLGIGVGGKYIKEKYIYTSSFLKGFSKK